jgi:CRP-like cAMP-binding protein
MPIDLSGINLQEFPLFHDVEEEVVRRFLGVGFRFQYEAGTPLISAKDVGETFFMIMQGTAKLVLLNSRAEELNVTLFKAGDFFGELSMLEPQTARSANVIAVSEIDVVTLQKKDFLKMMNQYPALSLNLARVLGQRLRTMNERMTTERLTDELSKVAQTFLHLAKKGRVFNEQGAILLPQLSLKEWALFCFTNSEGFMASMEKLKAQGAVEWQNQRIAITNVDMLRQCAKMDGTSGQGGPS